MTLDALSRRSLLRGLVVTAVGGIAGYAVARNSAAAKAKTPTTAANGYGRAPSTGGRLLARVDQVPSSGGLILDDPAIVLTRGSGDDVHGFSAVCTHQGCTVGSVANDVITCPCHGSHFNAQTGAVISGPAPRPLPAIAVVVRDGAVYTT
ncbi:MAG TPA: Rieske (2Fe-2S) protein [Jatrophihabitantaceae bacterium]|nr:Rieske (2Fe-2S) protein [Jatrophihabitantaceae bacterium]